MEGSQGVTVLKRDSFGRVERRGERVRRVACGSRLPLSAWIARRLLAREARALRALDGLAGVPRVFEVAGGGRGLLEREWIAGQPLHLAAELPTDFFDQLDALVHALHERGVCHNDLHKEQNVLAGSDGWPHLIDFQLASVHRRRGKLFASRARDDLRHVEKHRRRYTRAGRGPEGRDEPSRGSGHGIRRSWIARIWRRSGKPAYNWITRRVLGWSDGEARRPNSGPWPRWVPAVGAREQLAARGAPGDCIPPRQL